MSDITTVTTTFASTAWARVNVPIPLARLR
jgi:hypothetical protein